MESSLSTLSQTSLQLVEKLRDKHAYCATVESATGGLIAERITSIAGASAVFWGGFIVYNVSAKRSMVGIPRELIEQHGEVSPEVALALAEGGLRTLLSAFQLHSSQQPPARALCISTTGIAGPTGATFEKPVGLCYVGIAQTAKPARVHRLLARAPQDRAANQLFFATEALQFALEDFQ